MIGGDWHCQHITQVGAAVAAGNLAMWKVSSREVVRSLGHCSDPIWGHTIGQLYKKQPARSVA